MWEMLYVNHHTICRTNQKHWFLRWLAKGDFQNNDLCWQAFPSLLPLPPPPLLHFLFHNSFPLPPSLHFFTRSHFLRGKIVKISFFGLSLLWKPTETLATQAIFDFTRPLGVFHQKKIVFRLPSIIDTIYGNAWGEPALRVTVFSYRWRVVYLFSEGFYRVQAIATILHVGCTFLKKLIKLYRETSTVNYPAACKR